MTEVLVHYFTGTGNSLLAIKQLEQELTGYGYHFTYHAAQDGTPEQMEGFSLHIFSFPVYATSVPHIMRRYIRGLPDGGRSKAVVICTNGKVSLKFRDGYQGWSLHQARLYLKLKNYDVFYSEAMDYPHNLTLAVPPRKWEANNRIIEQNTERYPEMARQIAEGRKHHRRIFYPNMIWSIPFGLVFTLLARRLFGKLYATDTSCNNCGLCRKQCPVKAIKGGTHGNRWGWNCEGCLRCINICPQRSIQLSLVRLLFLLWAAVANPLFIIYRFIPDKLIGKGLRALIVQTMIYLVLYIVFVVLMDGLLYLLSFVPIIRRVIGFGYTKFYGRYHARQFEKSFIKDRDTVEK